MKTVFIVTSGEYSDYGISAVFSTREAAEAYIMSVSSDRPMIEEFYLDAPEGRMVWRVRFNEDGTVNDAPGWFPPSGYASQRAPEEPEWWEGRATRGAGEYPRTLGVEVYAETREQAIKAAAEKRGRFLAQEAGIS